MEPSAPLGRFGEGLGEAIWPEGRFWHGSGHHLGRHWNGLAMLLVHSSDLRGGAEAQELREQGWRVVSSHLSTEVNIKPHNLVAPRGPAD